MNAARHGVNREILSDASSVFAPDPDQYYP